MSLKYDLENVNTELPIDGGVAAFDPVSLRLAAQALSDRGGTVHLLPNVAGTQSPLLTQLATVATEPAEGIPPRSLPPWTPAGCAGTGAP